MRPVTYRPRIAAAVALLAAGGVLVGLALYLWRVGLERANQISSVLALFAALLSMVGGLVTLLWPRAAGPTATLPVRRLRTAWGPVRLDEELCRMVEATRSLTDEMPYPVSGPRHMTLSTVYVRQRVELRREEDEDPLLDPNGATRSHPRFRRTPQARAIPVSLPLERALGEHRHLLLEGGPGQGKSTTARQVCRELADAWLGAAASPPLRASRTRPAAAWTDATSPATVRARSRWWLPRSSRFPPPARMSTNHGRLWVGPMLVPSSSPICWPASSGGRSSSRSSACHW